MGLMPRRKVSRQAVTAALPALTVAVLAAALAAGGDPVREVLRFDRQAIAAGEAWRLVTGHLVHLGTRHMLLNSAGLLLVGLLVGREYRLRDWAAVTLASMASIDAGLWWLKPSLDWYVGLSGVLHGWFAAGIVGALLKRRPDAWLLLGLLLGKLVLEQLQGALPGSAAAAGGPVVVDAHLYGAVGGAIAGLLLTRLGGRRGL
ncbi:MAG: rhombosortase [Woeseiaceae bacterium]|nr:rhombosortase [Woeseiaceae bacterium]